MQSFVNLQRVDPGFEANNLLAFRIAVPEVNYRKFNYGARDPRREKLYEQLEQLLTDVPGVEFVAFGRDFNSSRVIITGREPPPALAKGKDVPLEENTATQMANPQYFHALRVPLISGRFFEERDSQDAPKVAIANEAFVRRFFPCLAQQCAPVTHLHAAPRVSIQWSRCNATKRPCCSLTRVCS